MINHCNNFIEVSLGNQKISLWTRLFGRLFGKVFLKYLKSLDFDINKYPKNSKTLKEFKPFSSEESFLNQKNRLTENIKIVKDLKSHYTIHNIYGNIETSLFKKLVHFHTSYHFNVWDFKCCCNFFKIWTAYSITRVYSNCSRTK